MGMRGTTCGLRADQRHHVFRLGSLIGLIGSLAKVIQREVLFFV